jgi:ATP-dependent Clp protease ATP-binding subunit ClpA
MVDDCHADLQQRGTRLRTACFAARILGTPLFELYSDRARKIIFLTRTIAGRRGAAALEPEHLIESLVVEDQARIAEALGWPREHLMQGLDPSRSFLSPETAADILKSLELTSANAEGIPDSLDMPMSPALGRTFKSAMALKEELKQKNVEPLHLLAAELSQNSKATQILKDVGITTESVIAAIKSGEYF